MTRLIIPVLVTLFISGAVMAEKGDRISKLKQLCVADQGTGFNWEKGTWVRTRFVESKFIVSKVASPSDDEVTKETALAWANCTLKFLDQREFSYDGVKDYNSCLNVQELGDKNPDYLGCSEVHIRKKDSDEWDVTFHCSEGNFYMQPNGHFHKGKIHGQLNPDPKDDYKDSLTAVRLKVE